jgi:hypothetical protein
MNTYSAQKMETYSIQIVNTYSAQKMKTYSIQIVNTYLVQIMNTYLAQKKERQEKKLKLSGKTSFRKIYVNLKDWLKDNYHKKSCAVLSYILHLQQSSELNGIFERHGENWAVPSLRTIAKYFSKNNPKAKPNISLAGIKKILKKFIKDGMIFKEKYMTKSDGNGYRVNTDRLGQYNVVIIWPDGSRTKEIKNEGQLCNLPNCKVTQKGQQRRALHRKKMRALGLEKWKRKNQNAKTTETAETAKKYPTSSSKSNPPFYNIYYKYNGFIEMENPPSKKSHEEWLEDNRIWKHDGPKNWKSAIEWLLKNKKLSIRGQIVDRMPNDLLGNFKNDDWSWINKEVKAQVRQNYEEFVEVISKKLADAEEKKRNDEEKNRRRQKWIEDYHCKLEENREKIDAILANEWRTIGVEVARKAKEEIKDSEIRIVMAAKSFDSLGPINKMAIISKAREMAIPGLYSGYEE